MLALTGIGLLGEVFYTGAVTILLADPYDDEPPSLRRIAGKLNYGRLIAIDVIYVVLVALGLTLFVVPGVLVFVYLGLAAPVVEMERRTIRRRAGPQLSPRPRALLARAARCWSRSSSPATP